MKNQKILFITAPYHAGVVEVAGSWVPLYMVCLAGAAQEAGFHAEIYDAMTKNVGFEEIRRRIEESQPDYVAVSAITCTAPDSTKIIELAKSINPAIKTIMGGVHSTFMFEELFASTNSLDYVVRGEGEVTLPELLLAVKNKNDLSKIKGIAYQAAGKIIKTPRRPFLENLDNLPMAWDCLDWDDYTYYILPGTRLGAVCTSRGCPQQCTFCSQQKMWRQTWRARSPEDVMREIEFLNTKYGVDVVLFTDDYPTPDQERWEKLLDLLIEKNLGVKILMETRAEDIIRDKEILHKYKQAGIIHIYVGTEATSQKSLDLIKKDLSIDESREALKLLRDINIITETSMILGFPDETPETVAETLRLAMEFNPDFGHFLAIAPWPYADIYSELKEHVTVFDYRKYNLIDPIIKPKNMTHKEIDEAIVDCYKTFYMNKFKEMHNEEDPFKKNYMLTSMKLIMTTSFIKKKLGNLGHPDMMKGGEHPHAAMGPMEHMKAMGD